MSVISNTVNYLHDQVLLEGFFAYEENIVGRRPLVLIHHAWAGRDEFVADKAKKLAAMGYLAFATDMYGQGKVGVTQEECANLMQPFIKDRALLQARLLAGLKAAKLLPWTDEEKIAAIGFCFGGLCALDLARTGIDIKGVVSFHGLLGSPENISEPNIKAKVLVLHGHDDPMGLPEQVLALQTELTKAGADWQVQVYGNTMHAFTNPKANNPDFGTVYQAQTDQRAWLSMQNFLTEIFA